MSSAALKRPRTTAWEPPKRRGTKNGSDLLIRFTETCDLNVTETKPHQAWWKQLRQGLACQRNTLKRDLGLLGLALFLIALLSVLFAIELEQRRRLRENEVKIACDSAYATVHDALEKAASRAVSYANFITFGLHQQDDAAFAETFAQYVELQEWSSGHGMHILYSEKTTANSSWFFNSSLSKDHLPLLTLDGIANVTVPMPNEEVYMTRFDAMGQNSSFVGSILTRGCMETITGMVDPQMTENGRVIIAQPGDFMGCGHKGNSLPLLSSVFHSPSSAKSLAQEDLRGLVVAFVHLQEHVPQVDGVSFSLKFLPPPEWKSLNNDCGEVLQFETTSVLDCVGAGAQCEGGEVSEVELLGKNWEFSCNLPGEADSRWTVLTVFVVSIICVIGVIIALKLFTSRNLIVEALVKSRTRQLMASVELHRKALATQEAIVQAISDPMVLYNDVGRILSMNKPATQATGRKVDARLSLDDLFILKHRRESSRRVDHALVSLAQRGAIKTKLRVKRADRRTFLAEGVCGRAKQFDENLNVCVFRDLTEFITRESELRKARDLAQTASTQKTEIVAFLCHELRNPLNAVSVSAELMMDDVKENEEKKKTVESILRSCRLMATVMDDVVDLTKLKFDQLQLKAVPINVRALIEGVFEEFHVVATDKKLEYVRTVAKDIPPCVNGDPARLHQVLTNLVSNGVKFTNEGRVELAVSMALPFIQFSVTDTGMGILEDDIPTLFKTFSQANRSLTRQFGGTGLGLSIVKSLVKRMGGRITVKSTPGVGSTFSVLLPYVASLTTDESPKEKVFQHREFYRSFDSSQENTPESDARMLNMPESDARMLNMPERSSECRDSDFDSPVGLPLSFQLPASPGFQLPPITDIEVKDAMPTERTLDKSPSECSVELSLVAADVLKPTPPPDNTYHLQPVSNRVKLFPLEKTRKCVSPAALHILVVEDNVVNRKLVLMVLKKEKIPTTAVVDGLEAVKAVQENPNLYSLILMDIVMPNLDGVQATRQIRSLGFSGFIVALTANAQDEQRAEYLQTGMDDVITKPFRRQALVDKIHRFLGTEPPTLV